MPDFRHLPLGQLVLYCPSLLQLASADEHKAWRELQRRALVEQNGAAWDALMTRLWPGVLFLIYERAPEIAPATAERLAQHTISEYKHWQAQPVPTSSASPALPTHESLLVELRRLINQLLD